MQKMSKVEYDFTLFVLCCWGIVTLFSASSFFGEYFHDGDSLYFLKRQFIWYGAGFALYLFANRFPLTFWRKISFLLFFLSILLNALTYLKGFGYQAGGANRWIQIGVITFQPSELAKISLILYLGHILESRREGDQLQERRLLAPLALILSLFLIVYGQNDFSTTFFLFIMTLLLLYVAGIKRRYLFLILFISVAVGVFMVASEPYRLKRVEEFFNGFLRQEDVGYQLKGAYRALNSGRWLGVGLGEGVVKNGGLPVAQSDFIMGVLGEELGFFGVLAYFLLNGYFIFRIFSLLIVKRELYPQLIGQGVLFLYLLQVLINLGVVTGVVPTTGIPLPLFSAGGSSLLMTLLGFSLLRTLLFGEEFQSSSKRKKEEEEEVQRFIFSSAEEG